MLKKVNTFKVVSIKHNKQTDRVSCGIYVNEVMCLCVIFQFKQIIKHLEKVSSGYVKK